MATGIIFVIIGAVIFILDLIVGINYGTILASMFIIGGFIILTVEKHLKKDASEKLDKKSEFTNSTWKCKICGSPNLAAETVCINCKNPK